MIDEIKANINTEIEMLREISNYVRKIETSGPDEAKLLINSMDSLKSNMKLINNSIPNLLSSISLAKPLSDKPILTKLEKISFKGQKNEINVVLNRKDKEDFIEQLRINEQLIRKMKKRSVIEEEKFEGFKASRGYLKLANRFFLGNAQKMISKGYFGTLSFQLKRANIDILFASYIAMMLLTTLLAFIASIFITTFFILFNINLSPETSGPIISLYSGDFLKKAVNYIWIPVALPLITFIFLNYYPSSEKDSLEKKIDQEIPFAAIHMSAISGSGVEPSEIFKIIAISKEYPYLKKEITKVLNQINLYGYDLVTALNNVAKATPSSKLTELFSGLSTTITSGGNLQEFFEKRSETLLINYRLEREKYTKVAETFMDIYISVVIAAPMILMILLVMISVTNFDVGFTREQMTLGIILIISLVNVLFLAFLHMKQPTY